MLRNALIVAAFLLCSCVSTVQPVALPEPLQSVGLPTLPKDEPRVTAVPHNPSIYKVDQTKPFSTSGLQLLTQYSDPEQELYLSADNPLSQWAIYKLPYNTDDFYPTLLSWELYMHESEAWIMFSNYRDGHWELLPNSQPITTPTQEGQARDGFYIVPDDWRQMASQAGNMYLLFYVTSGFTAIQDLRAEMYLDEYLQAPTGLAWEAVPEGIRLSWDTYPDSRGDTLAVWQYQDFGKHSSQGSFPAWIEVASFPLPATEFVLVGFEADGNSQYAVSAYDSARQVQSYLSDPVRPE